MVPYEMREVREHRKAVLEVAAAAAALLVLLLCSVSDVPRVYLTTPAARAAQERESNRQAFARLEAAKQELQVREDAMQAELAQLTRLLQNTQSQLAGLTEGQKGLEARAATTATRLQQFEATVHQTNERLTEFSESQVLERITKERDNALLQAKQGDDQIRRLTLQLQRAGVYP
jgi:chromosome segregation ATPase